MAAFQSFDKRLQVYPPTTATAGTSGTSSGTAISITATPPITVTPDPITGTGDISHDASGVVPTTYGFGTTIPWFTVEADGHITNAGEREACVCVTDVLPPFLFQFPSNNVLGYDITRDDTISSTTSRVSIVAMLGDGTSTLYSGGYTGDGSGDGIYNLADDKIYFLSRKYTGANVTSLAAWNEMLVQWDPRTLAIASESTLPGSWSTSGASPTIVDVTDGTAWLYEHSRAEMKGYELVGLTEIFTTITGDGGLKDNYDLGDFIVSGKTFNLIIANSGTGDLELIETIGATTNGYVSIGTLLPVADIPVLSETGDLRRNWLPSKNLLFLHYPAAFAVGTRIGVIIDLSLGVVAGAHLRYINSILGVLDFSAPKWDLFLERVYAQVGAGGQAEITQAGYISRLYGSGGDYDTGFPLGGSLFMWSLMFLGGGEFIPQSNANPSVADRTYETANSTSGGEAWDFGPVKTVAVQRQYRGFPDPLTLIL